MYCQRDWRKRKAWHWLGLTLTCALPKFMRWNSSSRDSSPYWPASRPMNWGSLAFEGRTKSMFGGISPEMWCRELIKQSSNTNPANSRGQTRIKSNVFVAKSSDWDWGPPNWNFAGLLRQRLVLSTPLVWIFLDNTRWPTSLPTTRRCLRSIFEVILLPGPRWKCGKPCWRPRLGTMFGGTIPLWLCVVQNISLFSFWSDSFIGTWETCSIPVEERSRFVSSIRDDGFLFSCLSSSFTSGNLIALMVHARPGDECILGDLHHTRLYEGNFQF